MTKRKHNITDPYAQRESEKYENPIVSREFILKHLEELGRPATRDELAEAFGVTDDAERYEALFRRLRAMERDGQLIRNRRGGYGPVDKMNLVRGRVIGHKDGFGFVVSDEGGSDLFLSAYQMRSVFDGDKVLVRVAGIDHRGRREGAVVEVLESAVHRLVGRFFIEAGVAYVVPDNKRISHEIMVPMGEQGTAEEGQFVVVDIVKRPTIRSRAVGRIVEVLGDEMAPGMEIDVAIRSHGLPHVWPTAVLEEIQHLTPEVPESTWQGRKDLRHLPLVTIDGEDAQDFDDAVYAEKRPRGGWRLFVAIADVSHYVRPGSALDEEAFQRGNSVYFPGHVIPMLPEILSNELCSLRPQVNRLCMVCEMNISATGKLTAYQFYPAVMRSQARLTYGQVAALFNDDSESLQEHPELIPHLLELYRLYQVLLAKREARGAIDFDTVETRVIFSADRKIEQIVPVQRNDAHRLIEECMLLANVAAASYQAKQEIPTLYRVHGCPAPEKLTDLRQFLAEFNLALGGGKQPQSKDYVQLLKTIQGRSDFQLLQTVLLRSLNQAVYATDAKIGHFGLAYPAYTHFTSPIRRYPDLLVHRAIKHLLSDQPVAEFSYGPVQMVSNGEHCSLTERRADEATRDAMDWLKCEFMLDKVGEEFDGMVTSVTGFGLFIELSSVHVEGLVHVSSLKTDYYQFDPIRHQLRGERTGATYCLGDRLRVRVVRVGLEDKQIDFELIGQDTSAKPSDSAKPSQSKKAKKKSKKQAEKPQLADKKSVAKKRRRRFKKKVKQ